MTSSCLIPSLRHQIEKSSDINALQVEIVDLILHTLEAAKDGFGEWEKVHFSNAITALTLSIHEFEQPPHKWLMRCLADLEMAITPVQLRDSTHRIADGSVRKARYKQFVDALGCLRIELTSANVSSAKVA